MKRECRSVNVDGTRTVIDAVAKRSPSAFLVHVSSANVYPDSSLQLREDSPTSPRTFYGRTKLESEALVLDAVSRGVIRAAILRPAMVFGPGSPGNLRRLVSFVRRGRFLLIGDGNNLKSMAPIDTVVRAILAVTDDAAVANGEIYNVASGTLSMREIGALIADELELSPRTTRLPLRPLRGAGWLADALSTWTSLPSIEQMVTTYASSSVLATEKLESLPSYRAAGDLEQALRATVRAVSASR
jgi:nucleoside-diphosphate-sugar epimerase